MNLNQVLPYVVPYVVLSVAVLLVAFFLVSVVLLAGLKKQTRQLACQGEANREALEKVADTVAVLGRCDLETMGRRITDLENRKPITIPEPTAPAFVGASRRGQVLRLHRNGESAVDIAETLGVSQGEVKLTLKLQDLYSQTVL